MSPSSHIYTHGHTHTHTRTLTLGFPRRVNQLESKSLVTVLFVEPSLRKRQQDLLVPNDSDTRTIMLVPCVCLSVCLSVGRSVCLSDCLSVGLSVCLSVGLYTRQR